MSYGISIKNASGLTVVDQNFKNYEVLTSGSYSVPAYGTASDLTILSSYPNGILMVKPPSGAFLCVEDVTGTTSYRMYLYSSPAARVSGTVSWAVLGVTGSSTLSGYGLAVRNLSGEVVFNSNKSYFAIKNIVTMSPTYNSYVTANVGAFEPYIPVFNIDDVKLILANGYDGVFIWEMHMIKISGTTATMTLLRNASASPADPYSGGLDFVAASTFPTSLVIAK